MLDRETASRLIKRAKAGEEAAKETLLLENANLMKSIVKRYLGKGVEYDDLFQLASIGLLKAVAGFDESYNVAFSTYAVPMIAGEIKRFMRDDGSIKVSRTIKASAKLINKFIEDYCAEHGAQPTIKEIADKFKMPQSEVVFTMGSTHMPVSIFARSDYKDEKSQYLLDKLPVDDGQDDMLDVLELRSCIEALPERDKKVIVLRYFRDMTQAEVAKALGVSQVQVSRIESRIVKSFKERLTG